MSIYFQVSDELIALAEFDPNYSKQKLDEVKNKYRKLIGSNQSQDDYLTLFHEFPLIQSVIKILFNYQMLVAEFEKGSNPFYGTTVELKKHHKNLETVLKQFRGALEISQKLSDTETAYRLQRTINVFEAFLDNPSDLLSKLNFFKIIDDTIEDKQTTIMKLLLYYNPFNDPLLIKWEDCVYYLEMLKFFDGFDVTLEALAKSTYIKLHKIFELSNPQIYMQQNNPSDPLKSIFEKIGREDQSIDLKRLKNVRPKTFYKGIAIFDYSKENNFYFNHYYEYAMRNANKDAVIQDRLHRISISFDISTSNEAMLITSFERIYQELLSF